MFEKRAKWRMTKVPNYHSPFNMTPDFKSVSEILGKIVAETVNCKLCIIKVRESISDSKSI